MRQKGSDTTEIHIKSASESETVEIGTRIGSLLTGGDVVALTGELGAGKTYFTKGLARGLGLEDTTSVTSPSYMFMRQYPTQPALNHFDAYRIEKPDDLDAVGAELLFDPSAISVIEWADRVEAMLPEVRLNIEIRHKGEEERDFYISGNGLHLAEVTNKVLYYFRQMK